MERGLESVADAVRATLKAVGLGDVWLRIDYQLRAVVLVDVHSGEPSGDVVGLSQGTRHGLPDMAHTWVLVPPEEAPSRRHLGALVPRDGPYSVALAAQEAIRCLVDHRLAVLSPLEDEVGESG